MIPVECRNHSVCRSACCAASIVDHAVWFAQKYVWNCANVDILHAQIAALNLVLKRSNMRQNQKNTFSGKLTRIPWIFNKIFYFFKKICDPPFLIWKNLLTPFWSKKKYPQFSGAPLLVKNDTSLRQVSFAYNNNSELTACGISFTHRRKIGDSRLSLEVHHKTTYQGRSIPYQRSQWKTYWLGMS